MKVYTDREIKKYILILRQRKSVINSTPNLTQSIYNPTRLSFFPIFFLVRVTEFRPLVL